MALVLTLYYVYDFNLPKTSLSIFNNQIPVDFLDLDYVLENDYAHSRKLIYNAICELERDIIEILFLLNPKFTFNLSDNELLNVLEREHFERNKEEKGILLRWYLRFSTYIFSIYLNDPLRRRKVLSTTRENININNVINNFFDIINSFSILENRFQSKLEAREGIILVKEGN